MNDGKTKKSQLDAITEQINNFGNVDFSVEEYDKLVEERTTALLDQQTKRNEVVRIKNLIQQLKTSELCPTCGKKLDNVDNSKQIKEQEDLYNALVVEGKKVTEKVNELNAVIDAKKENREKYNKLNALNTQKPVIEVNIERLRN